MAGKLGVRGIVNAVAPGQLVYITDQLSQRRFLVDTGAAYSILPHHSSGQPTGPLLAGPDGHPLACWGDKPVQLVLDGCHFQWTFLLAAVQCPIIGVDFLRAHQLLVDPLNNRLLDLSSLRFLKADTGKPHPVAPGISSVDKTEGGCAWVPLAQSTPPGFSSPSLPPLVPLFYFLTSAAAAKCPGGSSTTAVGVSGCRQSLQAATSSCPQCFSPHQDSWASSSLKISPLRRRQAAGSQSRV